MAEHNELGRLGEDLAAEYMVEKGWYIRERDWRFRGTDIDLICIDEDDTILVFVEVKTRSSDEYGRPEEAVDASKRRNIMNAATAYMTMHRKENRYMRFDIISVTGPDYRIRHIEDAFSLMDVYEDRHVLKNKNKNFRW